MRWTQTERSRTNRICLTIRTGTKHNQSQMSLAFRRSRRFNLIFKEQADTKYTGCEKKPALLSHRSTMKIHLLLYIIHFSEAFALIFFDFGNFFGISCSERETRNQKYTSRKTCKDRKGKFYHEVHEEHEGQNSTRII